ncbi:MAG: cation diffusion facilitator family transporter, partial [Bacilli bacterium]|nr:cation diffusion facilitator family transporter [Bacilli bacterium]
MRKLIVKLFIKDHQNYQDNKVRVAYGKLSGIVGIVSNIFLTLVKIISGMIIGSLAIIADGINNLSDAGTSIITYVGFKLSSTPADKDHPFGHQRIEYVTGLIVAIFIFTVGLLLAYASIDKIINPKEIKFNWLIIVFLVISILIKIWQSRFYRQNGKLIKSEALIATSVDSLNDVFATSGVLLTGLIMIFFGINLDGYMSALVSIIIVFNGIKFVKQTGSLLIGEAPSEEYTEKVLAKLNQFPGVLGVHDLVIHQYGPVKKFITAHVEVDRDVDIVKNHQLIDRIEREVSDQLNCNLVIHMDPIDTKCSLTNQYK